MDFGFMVVILLHSGYQLHPQNQSALVGLLVYLMYVINAENLERIKLFKRTFLNTFLNMKNNVLYFLELSTPYCESVNMNLISQCNSGETTPSSFLASVGGTLS
jgi:uncharacterized protein YwgA